MKSNETPVLRDNGSIQIGDIEIIVNAKEGGQVPNLSLSQEFAKVLHNALLEAQEVTEEEGFLLVEGYEEAK